MSNYGFNENEIVATKTIQIDKDGFHRIVEGTDGGSNTPDEGNTSSGLKDFNAVVVCDPEDVNYICVRAFVRVGSDAYDTLSDTDNAYTVGFAIDPLNSVNPSTLPKTMSQDDMMAFANAHTFLSPSGILLHAPVNDPPSWIGDGSYGMFGISVPDPELPSERTDYTLPAEDLQAYAIADDINGRFHYEFDLTILVVCDADDNGNRNIFADVVHVVTPEYLR